MQLKTKLMQVKTNSLPLKEYNSFQNVLFTFILKCHKYPIDVNNKVD